MSIKIDTKELDAFADKLKKAATQTQEQVVDKALKNLASEVLRRAIKQTPRDTSNLARRWTDHDTPVDQMAKNVSQISWLNKAPIVQNGKDRTITISNSAEYGVYVEYGHRINNGRGWVPGSFMLTRALQDVDKMKDQMIADVINKYFGDLL